MQLQKAQKIADKIVEALAPYCLKIEVAGSIRRRKENVNDIDLVVVPSDFGGFISRLKQNTIPKTVGKENIIVHLRDRDSTQLDIFIAKEQEKTLFETKPGNWGTLLLCRTGSKEHNVFIANLAANRGMRWHPYNGLYHHNRVIAWETEEKIYEALGIPFIAPENREIHLIKSALPTLFQPVLQPPCTPFSNIPQTDFHFRAE